jgi:hypothetical protein
MKKLATSRAVRIWAVLLALCGFAMLARVGYLGEKPERLLMDLRNDGPNAVGMDLITQNYYEELLKEDREPEWQDARVLGALLRRLGLTDTTSERRYPHTWGSVAVVGATIDHETGFLEHSLRPNMNVIHRDLPFRTNRWGHRDDKDYELQPEDGVFRIVVVGSSNSMGQGVAVEDGMIYRLERKLNDTLPKMNGYDRYEIVNISVPRYHLLERVYVARHVAPRFHPHLMLVEVTMLDMRRALYEGLTRRVSENRDLGFDFVREIVSRSKVRPSDSTLRVEQRLQRFSQELAIGCFHELAKVQNELGFPVVPMILRMEVDALHHNLIHLDSIAQNAGLITLRVFDAYEGQEGEEVYLGGNDFHPNAKGHALLAEEIFIRMLELPSLRNMLLPNVPFS